MSKKSDTVYQFKIILRDTKPPVWRRVQVPENYTFWDLHVAIQGAMGWTDSHLHEFRMLSEQGDEHRIGIPDDEWQQDTKFSTGWDVKIADWFSLENNKARYEYDFGDSWIHLVTLEDILDAKKDRSYPACLTGKRACPPEDCGGVLGYEDICGGNHPFQEGYLPFEPNYFDCEEVFFENPKERLRQMLDWR